MDYYNIKDIDTIDIKNTVSFVCTVQNNHSNILLLDFGLIIILKIKLILKRYNKNMSLTFSIIQWQCGNNLKRIYVFFFYKKKKRILFLVPTRPLELEHVQRSVDVWMSVYRRENLRARLRVPET
jgi:hypothetical protein